MIIKKASEQDIGSVVNLHLESLQDGLLPLLGLEILLAFYKELLQDDGSEILVAKEGKEIVGVAAISKNPDRLIAKFKGGSFFKIAKGMAGAFLRKPQVTIREVFFSGKLRGYPELMFLYTKPSMQGRGIGKRLLAEVFKLFFAMKVNEFIIVISPKNEKGKRFYEKNGFRKIKEASLFDCHEAYLVKLPSSLER